MTSRRSASARIGLVCAGAVVIAACGSESIERPVSIARAHNAANMPMMADAHAGHGDMQMTADSHAAHRTAMETTRYAVTERHYDVPDVVLIDQSGTPVALPALLEGNAPIALNFIFTTCTTICPVMTATFAQMRRELGPAGAPLRMVSISIDPEYDRPDVLEAYAERFGAGEGWTFLTGDSGDVMQVLNTFGTFFGSKMNHKPITLLKRPQDPAWIRVAGLASGKDLAHEVKAELLD